MTSSSEGLREASRIQDDVSILCLFSWADKISQRRIFHSFVLRKERWSLSLQYLKLSLQDDISAFHSVWCSSVQNLLIHYPENRAQLFYPRGEGDKIGECEGISNCFSNRSFAIILPYQFHLPELPGATFEGLVRYTGLLLSSRWFILPREYHHWVHIS